MVRGDESPPEGQKMVTITDRYTKRAASLEVLTDARSQKALEILRRADQWSVVTIMHNGKKKVVYEVPSSIKSLRYHTNVNACSCPDFTRRFRAAKAADGFVSKHLACKHMLAVRLFTMLESAKTANLFVREELAS